jgi:membrane-associated phospholipid phosphatase
MPSKLLPVDFYDDAGVQMTPSPVFPLPLTPLSSQTTILIVLLPQVVAVSTVFLPVIHMVVVAVSIVVAPVMVMVVISLYGHNRNKQGSTHQERSHVTFHRITLLNVRTSSERYQTDVL